MEVCVPWSGALFPGEENMRIKALFAASVAVAAATFGLSTCAVDHSGGSSEKPTIRLGYQSFPSGDLIVKNNKWLEEALPDLQHQVDQVRFRGRRQHRVHRQGTGLRGAGLEPGGPRFVGSAEHSVHKVAFVLDVAGDNEALVARDGARRQPSIADLRGKRIATPFASTAHYSLLAALASERAVSQLTFS